MTIRFAAPPTAYGTRLSARDARAALKAPDNDNFDSDGFAEQASLHAALRHFAQDGLSAARTARHKAQDALRDGNAQQYRWWLDICRSLDRRMAGDLAATLGRHG